MRTITFEGEYRRADSQCETTGIKPLNGRGMIFRRETEPGADKSELRKGTKPRTNMKTPKVTTISTTIPLPTIEQSLKHTHLSSDKRVSDKE